MMRWVVGVSLLAEATAFHMALPASRQHITSSASFTAEWTQKATSTAARAEGSSQHGRISMSSAPDAEQPGASPALVPEFVPPPQTQSSGGGDGTAPPGLPEQTGTEIAEAPTPTVFVAGGSGFVGSEICSQLVDAGCNVIALSRKGAPANGASWTKSVKWVKGNAVNQDLYRAELRQSDTVVSCVGGFGKTDAYMGLVNGEANIKLAEAAADAGVKRFVFVSVHDYKAPSLVKKIGYFDGKRRTEKIIGELFGDKGVILKPAFIYGSRDVKLTDPKGRERTINLPLQRVGGPLAKLTSTDFGKKIAGSGLPLADVAWTQPLSTEEVAKSAVKCCVGGTYAMRGGRGKDSGDAIVLKVQDMVAMAA